jgi:DNA polymerase I
LVAQVKAFTSTDTGYPDKTIVTTQEAFEAMFQFLQLSPVVVFDFETSGVAWFKHACACAIAFGGFDPNTMDVRYFYVPFRHHTGEQQLPFWLVSSAIGQLLEDESKLKIAHNIKFDEHMARRDGWQVLGPRYDTMIAAHLFDENRRIALKVRAVSDLGRQDAPEFEAKIDLEVERLAKLNGMNVSDYRYQYGYSEINIQLCGTYACFDVEFTFLLYLFYEREGISKKYSRIWNTEMQLTHVLVDMERNGIPIDVEYLTKLRGELEIAKKDLTFEIEHRLGRKLGDFNLASDDDMRDYLINQCRLTLTKTTKKGKFAVDREVLESFSDVYPVLTYMSRWREVEKLLSTYTTSILERLDENNILHPDFQQVGTNSGRLSCKNPNFQNQPVDSDARAREFCGLGLEEGGVDPWSIRRAYITAAFGWVRLFFDYSQIELRVVAFYSRDPIMVEAFLNGDDIHDRTSLEVFGSTDKPFRRKSKVINFGLTYGLSPMGFSRQTGVPIEEAEHHFAVFFQRYKGITNFKNKFRAYVYSNNGYFENLFGRPKRILNTHSFSKKEKNRAERQEIAVLIQGTAAELTKESLVRIHDAFDELKLQAKIVATVHDEIQIDCPIEEITQVVPLVKNLMEDFKEFEPIPVIVDCEYTTTSWAEKKGVPSEH